MRVFLIGVVVLLLVAGCGKRQIGEFCEASSECSEGTSCVLSGSRDIGDGGLVCTTQLLCSTVCSADAQCVTALGPGHICVADCHQGSCLKGSRGGGP